MWHWRFDSQTIKSRPQFNISWTEAEVSAERKKKAELCEANPVKPQHLKNKKSSGSGLPQCLGNIHADLHWDKNYGWVLPSRPVSSKTRLAARLESRLVCNSVFFFLEAVTPLRLLVHFTLRASSRQTTGQRFGTAWPTVPIHSQFRSCFRRAQQRSLNWVAMLDVYD